LHSWDRFVQSCQGNSGKINGRTRQDSPVIEEVDPETKKEVDGADPNWYLLPDPKYGKDPAYTKKVEDMVYSMFGEGNR
jgi:hypothetical protein